MTDGTPTSMNKFFNSSHTAFAVYWPPSWNLSSSQVCKYWYWGPWLSKHLISECRLSMTLDQFSLFRKKIITSKTKRGKYLPLPTLSPNIFLTERDIDMGMVQ